MRLYRRPALQAAGADPALAEPVVVEAGDLDAARRGGVDEAAVAQVDAVVSQAVEEDEVARGQRVPGHRRAVAELLGRVVGDGDPDTRVDVRDQARAVEAGGARAGPDVRRAQVRGGDPRDGRAPLAGRGLDRR